MNWPADPGRPGADDEAPGPAGSPEFAALARSDLVARIEDALRQAITAGQLAPGARLVEVDLARRFGVSRAPVREAARRLESLGLLVSRPGHGFAVRRFTARDIDDLFRVRLQLELASAELACERATDAELAEFPRKVDAMAVEARSLTAGGSIAPSLAFHAAIAEASGNRYLFRLLGNLHVELAALLGLGIASFYDPPGLVESHRPLAEALARRDVEAACRALRAHVEMAWELARLALIPGDAGHPVEPEAAAPDEGPLRSPTRRRA